MLEQFFLYNSSLTGIYLVLCTLNKIFLQWTMLLEAEKSFLSLFQENYLYSVVFKYTFFGLRWLISLRNQICMYWLICLPYLLVSNSLFIYLFILLFRAAPAAYGGSQARGQIGATAASLCHSHGNTGSKMRL